MMELVFSILSVIIGAMIVWSLLTRNLVIPKRKTKIQAKNEPTPRTVTAQETALLCERDHYEAKLERLSGETFHYKPYPESPNLVCFDDEKFSRVQSEKSAIGQCIRDINRELMALKEGSHES